jgi:hypothetical protein
MSPRLVAARAATALIMAHFYISLKQDYDPQRSKTLSSPTFPSYFPQSQTGTAHLRCTPQVPSEPSAFCGWNCKLPAYALLMTPLIKHGVVLLKAPFIVKHEA